MNHPETIFLFIISVCCSCCCLQAYGQQQQQQQPLQQPLLDEAANFPYYLQSPIKSAPNVNPEQINIVSQRAFLPQTDGFKLSQQPKRLLPITLSSGRQMALPLGQPNPSPQPQQPQQPPQVLEPAPNIVQSQIVGGAPNNNSNSECLYEKRYFSRLDECLSRRPYPTIGLLAFKNEDLILKRGLSDKYGCQFVLANGLFKNYQITKFNLDSDSQCLDNTKVRLNLSFSNVTLNYLWTLRCLNRADQLLDDATHDGQTVLSNGKPNTTGKNDASSPKDDSTNSICVGSSQNFGFASLQLSALESQVDLVTDIYKNWRVTNVGVAMTNPLLISVARGLAKEIPSEEPLMTPSETNIREWIFESLDGDELNWRYLHLFQNWSRNRMHSNFLDQFRRFLWISIQNCLKETSDRLIPSNRRPIEIFSSKVSM